MMEYPEKIPRETDKDYLLFVKYLNSDRDNVKFCVTNKIHLAKFSQIKLKNNWEERAAKYDQDLLVFFREQKKQAISQIAEDTAQEISESRKITSNLINQSLTQLLIRSQNPKHQIKIQDIERLVNIMQKLHTDINTDINTDIDLSHISDHDLAKIEHIITGKDGEDI